MNPLFDEFGHVVLTRTKEELLSWSVAELQNAKTDLAQIALTCDRTERGEIMYNALKKLESLIDEVLVDLQKEIN